MYMGSTMSYLPLMRAKGLITATLMWTLGTILVGVVIGLAYGEVLTKAKIVGVVFGLISIVLLIL
jgi:hypothetical protein